MAKAKYFVVSSENNDGQDVLSCEEFGTKGELMAYINEMGLRPEDVLVFRGSNLPLTIKTEIAVAERPAAKAAAPAPSVE